MWPECTYSAKAEGVLTEDEREAFAVFIAQNPNAGSIVRGTGGVRVIYFNRLTDEQIWLLTLYAKSDRSTIPAHELGLIREAIDHE